jgi:hypothetical protein
MAAWALPAFVVLRYGLLAFCSTVFFLAVVVNYPFSLDLSHWTGAGSALAWLMAATIVIFAFRTSLAGRPLFRGELLED